jgi:hypothetical protein
MALFPAALLQMRENTDLQIGDVALTKDGNETDDGIRERVARVKLNHGSILTLLDPAARFTIATPRGTIDVTPGCLLILQTDRTKTRLTCARGRIHLKRLDGTDLAVEAGYVLESTGSHTAVKPAADDSLAQSEIATATTAEQELRELQSRQSAHAPFFSAFR